MEKGIIVHTLIEDEKGKILILRRQPRETVLPGIWDIPGGTLEDGEDPAAGAIREAKEESGITPIMLRLAAYTSNVDMGKNKQFIRLIFRGKYSGEPILVDPEAHDAHRWIHPAHPPDLPLVDYLPECLKLLAEKG